jgi:hypothetical protein
MSGEIDCLDLNVILEMSEFTVTFREIIRNHHFRPALKK